MADSDRLSKSLGAHDATRFDLRRRRVGNPIRRSLERFQRQVRDRASFAVGTGFFYGLSNAAKLHPRSRPKRHQVEVIKNIPYIDDGETAHTLDIYYPAYRPRPWPVVFYVHGGGFSLLSKDTHWVMGLAYARFGYMVVNIS